MDLAQQQDKTLLVIYIDRPGCHCDYRFSVLVVYERNFIGVDEGNRLFKILCDIPKYKKPEIRGNRVSKIDPNCGCNGNEETGGSSYTLGCCVTAWGKSDEKIGSKGCKYYAVSPSSLFGC